MQRLFWLMGVALLAGCASQRMERVEPLQAPLVVLVRPDPPTRPAATPLIVIDPGHGGHDDGARCMMPPYPEKRAALQLAQLLQKKLTGLGYRIALTRCQDLFLTLHERAALANQRGASAFVSLHFNHCSNPTAKGLEIFYCANEPFLKRDLLSKELAESVLRCTIDATHTRDRGVKEANFVVIRTTRMPSILVEGGFLSNQEEGRQISELPYLDRLAQGIALGVHHYFVHEADADAPMSVYSEVAGRKTPSCAAKAKKLAPSKPQSAVATKTNKTTRPATVGATVSKQENKTSSKKPTLVKASKVSTTRAS